MDDNQHLDLFYHTCYSVIQQMRRYWLTVKNIQQLFSVQHIVDDNQQTDVLIIVVDWPLIYKSNIYHLWTVCEQSTLHPYFHVGSNRTLKMTFIHSVSTTNLWWLTTNNNMKSPKLHAENTLVLKPVRQNGKLVISFNLHSGLSVMARDWAFGLAVS